MLFKMLSIVSNTLIPQSTKKPSNKKVLIIMKLIQSQGSLPSLINTIVSGHKENSIIKTFLKILKKDSKLD